MRLEGRLELSGSVTGSAKKIEQLKEEANARFVKGRDASRRDEVARITGLNIDGRTLHIEIESGIVVRATDALLQFKNLLAKELGVGLKIGVRRITIDRLTIQSLAQDMNPEKAIALVGERAKVSVHGEAVEVDFRNLSEHDLQVRLVDRLVRLCKVVEEEPVESKATFGAVLQTVPPKNLTFHHDPAKLAEEEGWVVRFAGKGQWMFGPPMLALVKAIKEMIEEEICEPFGFREWMFPRLLPMEVYKKLRTYVEHLPDGVFYVCAPPRDSSAFDEFKREYILRGELRTDLLRKILDEPGYVLDAVQCPPFYQTFSGRRVVLEDLPIKAYDVLSGWTWRNEAGGTEGLVRTNEFYRMEMVDMGSPEEVQKLRDSLIDATARLMGRDLDLEWRIVAGAPFYMSPDEARMKTIDTSSRDKIPTLDIECYLPYRGSREKAEWLETSAGTVHRTFYVDAFKIKELKNRPIWTGCLGHGLTRWAAAVLSQHGMEFDKWPAPLKKKIGSLPPPIRFAR